VLEGTVRRSGSKVRVNAQLVDTRTDTGVWADGYERDLTEAFAIQSEIAQKVAEQLHVNISAAEKVAIERKPTVDLNAFDLYTQARSLLLASIFSATGDANLGNNILETPKLCTIKREVTGRQLDTLFLARCL